jgi:hypothetical protein
VIDDLSARLRALEIASATDRATTSAAIDHLTEAVNSLTTTVQEFRDTLNKGKGAVWLFGILAASVGGIISWIATHLFRT